MISNAEDIRSLIRLGMGDESAFAKELIKLLMVCSVQAIV
jgi:hypothetical protein